MVDNFAKAKKELEPKGMTVVEANVEEFRKVAQEKIWPAYKAQYGALVGRDRELQGLKPGAHRSQTSAPRPFRRPASACLGMQRMRRQPSRN